MSTKSLSLESTENSIFFKTPSFLEINEELRTRYASSSKIETLINELSEKGPLVGIAAFGPGFYEKEPFKLQAKHHGQEIYGWPVGAQGKGSANNTIMILGARKLEEKAYVYFTLSQDTTSDLKTYIRRHQPSKIDSKIYVVSFQTFYRKLVDLYLPNVVEAERKEKVEKKESSIFTKSEQEFIARLVALDLISILDSGEGEAKCRAIGQEIFNMYKKESNSSLAGKKAMQKMCDAMRTSASDGNLRVQFIERAWHGIGDDQYRWEA